MYCALMMLNSKDTNDHMLYLSGLCKANPSNTFLALWAIQRDWLNGEAALTSTELPLTTLQFQLYCCFLSGVTSLESSSPRQGRGAVASAVHQKISMWLFTEIKISMEKRGLVILFDISYSCLVACRCGTVSAHHVLRSSHSPLWVNYCASVRNTEPEN